ncbi:hypothetical protein [Paenibacillus sp. FSL H7-0331]|uniref:hypothetical protein n=1 Tax=Paenibacillus sp. FSL H7-0331 TaxID=1920421 RepID=UPI00096DDC45|nr:hypothetical protein [Paenibacillus sp. FSL H7-0331]OMF08425.1 hypothetical protein BK127_28905 [Paenibacillus sp. FSL H7-0331]
MSKFKRLAKIDDNLVQIEVPISDDELQERTADYLLLSPNQFAKKYRFLLFQPVKLNWRGKSFEVQLNA